eukprot:m.293510 g.293510  ORF g.293510 m.293510 type:complete len:293 (+) comp16246_c0_seq5:1552-2430(+)
MPGPELSCEVAKSGRSTCKSCKGLIPDRSLRIGVTRMMKGMHDGHSATAWHCATCYPLDKVDDLNTISGFKELPKKKRGELEKFKKDREGGKRPAPAGVAKPAKKTKVEPDGDEVGPFGLPQPPLELLKKSGTFKLKNQFDVKGPIFEDEAKAPWNLVGYSEDGTFVFAAKSPTFQLKRVVIFYDKGLGWCGGYESMTGLKNGPLEALAHLPNSVGETYPHLSTFADWVMVKDYTTPEKVFTCLERAEDGSYASYGMGIVSLKKGDSCQDIFKLSVKSYRKIAQNAILKALK